jgi:hypothetical protein
MVTETFLALPEKDREGTKSYGSLKIDFASHLKIWPSF